MSQSVYLFFGNDEYLVSLHARKQVEALCPEAEQALSLEIIEGEASRIDDAVAVLDQCLAAFRTVGLFGGKKVVWLRNASFFKNAIIMKNEQVKDLLSKLTADIKAGLAPEQFLVLSAPGLDKRSAFYKALASAGKVEEFSISERDYEARPAALERARQAFQEEGLEIDSNALQFFIDRTGFDTRQILNEVEKMTLYKRGEKRIQIADVQLITSPSGDALAWDFTDAVAQRNLSEALRLFHQLLFQKQTPVGLVVQLETLFNLLVRFREYLDAGWLQIQGNRAVWSTSPELDDYFSGMTDDPRKMHWFRVSKIAQQAAPHSIRLLTARKRIIVETHELMISEGTLPHELLFETLLAKLCARGSKRKTA